MPIKAAIDAKRQGELGLVRSSTAIATSNDAGWTASRRADAL